MNSTEYKCVAEPRPEKVEDRHIRLSIAIPTFNRCTYLADLLPSVLQQCVQLNATGRRIEVIVSDNASTDETSQYVRSFTDRTSFLVYSRNESNVGGELNFARCIEQARGDYIWMLGDDDLILEDAIEKVLGVLDLYSPELMVCIDALKVVSGDPSGLYAAGEAPVSIHASYREFLDFAATQCPNLLLAHTWIPSLVVRRTCYDLVTFQSRVGTYYPHMYAIGTSLFEGGKVLLYRSPTLGMRQKRAPWQAMRALLRRQNEYLLWLAGTCGNARIRKLVRRRQVDRFVALPGRVVRRVLRAKPWATASSLG